MVISPGRVYWVRGLDIPWQRQEPFLAVRRGDSGQHGSADRGGVSAAHSSSLSVLTGSDFLQCKGAGIRASDSLVEVDPLAG